MIAYYLPAKQIGDVVDGRGKEQASLLLRQPELRHVDCTYHILVVVRLVTGVQTLLSRLLAQDLEEIADEHRVAQYLMLSRTQMQTGMLRLTRGLQAQDAI